MGHGDTSMANLSGVAVANSQLPLLFDLNKLPILLSKQKKKKKKNFWHLKYIENVCHEIKDMLPHLKIEKAITY
jgi:hypothetical protein